MSLADDLRAAKALIDTPEKWAMRGKSLVTIFRDLGGDEYLSVRVALATAAGLSHHRKLTMYIFGLPHADVIAMFDRAIAAAEQSEASP